MGGAELQQAGMQSAVHLMALMRHLRHQDAGGIFSRRQTAFCNGIQRFVKNLPKLDRFVCGESVHTYHWCSATYGPHFGVYTSRFG